jgi:hypothetical protein
LKGCNYNRDEIAALVLSEMLSAKDKAIERPGIPPSQLFNPQNVCPAPLPVYRKNMFKHRSPVQQNYVADFDLVDMMTAKVSLFTWHLGRQERGGIEAGLLWVCFMLCCVCCASPGANQV